MSKDSSITLNQYAGQDGLKVSQVLRETCVNFADDANSYTIPQAIAKMKPLHVYVMVGSDDLDGSVSVDEFVNDYKQILQSIKSAYSACDVVACALRPSLRTPPTPPRSRPTLTSTTSSWLSPATIWASST